MTFDVAVIGCGPVGALAANLFGRLGLKTLVVEQGFDPYPLPRAVHVDHEAMRLFQDVALIRGMLPEMRAADGHLQIGADGGMIRYLGTAGRPKPFGWANDYFFYQPELESRLREGFTALPNVEFRLGQRFVGLVQERDIVEVALEDVEGGTSTSVRAKWVVACDGSKSPVRKHLGIGLDDLQFEEPWLVVDAEVDGPLQFGDLRNIPPGADLQKLAVMFCDPRRPTTLVPGRGNHRRWELMLLPGEDDDEMMRPDTVARLLAPWVGGSPHRIVRMATYRFHGLIARSWRAGRVFLAGDAAHQTPPFFGQGMCHGLRDVANLAWKIDLVERGLAGDRLLDSYQLERDPHVRAIISTAVETGRYICMLDPEAAAARDEAMRNRPPDAAATSAADFIPAIRDGALGGQAPGRGERFIQPWLSTEAGTVLLDDAFPSDWRVFAMDATVASACERAIRHTAPDLEIDVIDIGTLDDGGALADWLACRGAAAALVRPDFYVFGCLSRDGTPERLFSELASKLALAAAGPA